MHRVPISVVYREMFKASTQNAAVLGNARLAGGQNCSPPCVCVRLGGTGSCVAAGMPLAYRKD